MPRRTIPMIEVNEVLFRWSQGLGKKTIARSLSMSVNTVRDLLIQAEALGFKRFTSTHEERDHIVQRLKEEQCKKRTQPSIVQSQIMAHHVQIETWRNTPHMTLRQIQRLLGEQGHIFSETSLRRYVKDNFSSLQEGFLHLITIPGREAQVDFGYAGLMWDPKTQKKRKAWAFVMTLSHSRHRFVRFVFNQNMVNWIDCHIRAFEFFDGVPATIIIDNLKSGVIKANLYDPLINRAYQELERHYGFVVDPTRIRTPEHKGKVERNMPIIRQQILAGRVFEDIEAANRYAQQWARYEIGLRVTRTTGEAPWIRFERDEKSKLKALPMSTFECPQWQESKVHMDHHVVFNGSFYSVPSAYLGQMVWLRAGLKELKIFSQEKLIKIHLLSEKKGQWVTDEKDYPEYIRQYLLLDREQYLVQAKSMGESVYDFIEPLTEPLTRTRQRKILALFRLGEKYSSQRLNNACERILKYGGDSLFSISQILKKELDLVNREKGGYVPVIEGAYLRDASEFCVN